MTLKNLIYSSFLFLFMATTSVFGQNGTGVIKGIILDAQTTENLIGATIKLDATTVGTTSDFEGTFLLTNVPSGVHRLMSSYFSYEPNIAENVFVKATDTTFVTIVMEPEKTNIVEIKITAKANRARENVALMDQKNAVFITQNLSSEELTRKGLSDAESSVASVAGISKQDGVKNVFVRGLGDRYNQTLLNGLPIPSEDPEYKNISLSFFEADLIKSISVSKVFSAENAGDVGGAVIDISSKELFDDYAFRASISTGFNFGLINKNFRQVDGMNYLGFSQQKLPLQNEFNFKNSLDPKVNKLPLNERYAISGGKRWKIKQNPLSFYLVATHSSFFKFREETVRNITTSGVIYQDQQGTVFQSEKNQMVLANINYQIAKKHSLAYNFLLIHATNAYFAEFLGKHTERFQDGINESGYLRRQQINDNRLFVHQLITKWELAKKWTLKAAASFNALNGFEPDRRENYLSQKADGNFGFTGGNRQKRFFSNLKNTDFNADVQLDYQLKDKIESGQSKVFMAYKNRWNNTNFEATEFNFSAVQGELSLSQMQLDDYYNFSNYRTNEFTVTPSYPSKYAVTKLKHAATLGAVYYFSKKLGGIVGLNYDFVDLNVAYDVPGRFGNDSIRNQFFLPNLNFRYRINEKHSLRIGASKTYTLPQDKEISPYQYVNIGFTSEGNPNIKVAQNYNLDLKWDYYLSASEIISASVFAKRVVNPIGRVDKGNSAGLLTYDNIGANANILGIEIEFRKNIFSLRNAAQKTSNRLSVGGNFSYIFTETQLEMLNTPTRKSALEGASPFLVNANLSYQFSNEKGAFMTTLVFNYFSDRIFTIGTMGFNDIIEKAVPTLDWVVEGKVGKRVALRLKVENLLNPTFRLTRKVGNTDNVVLLNQFKKGINASIGVRFEL